MKFKYQAKTREGELQVGFVDAGTRDSAATILGSHDLFVLKLEEAEKIRWYGRLASYFGGVRRDDMVVFTRQLATLLEARLSLSKALATLYDQTRNAALREAVFQISQDVDSGLSLSQALERQREIFSEFFISMVRSAEVTGTLDQVAGFLADFTEREATLVSRARSALIYPMIVVALFVAVAGIMITFVFPQIQPVFEQADVPLPLLSQMLISAGVFINRFWLAIVLALVVVALIVLDYFRTPEGRSVLDDMKIRLPIVRKVYLPLTVTRFASAATILLKGGIPVAQAMEIAGETVDNVLYRDVLHEVSRDIREGVPLSEAIAKHANYFPVVVSQMVAVGEATGQLDQMLTRIATFYGRESDMVVNNLVDLIQPVLMVGIGVLVGILFASILLPLYQLTASFGQ
ncbi:MAG: hypothetical protein A3A43_00820 [Candidatus Liptonbacteria bacterium RIFCSPLOWO2_01_FULL_56_20]|uniref:Type II secretion system protein GspF domain-containing protein n=1 Tax=Candidatus Liptonbacteria bacterium RIFCSPLOWO2_01_FULL_56_20 TaxID=1798652 RepID=A0A1G2CH42_9BACT|nr:MAG: hypothetical protein UY96_C0020G0010 [Parcubacteria group bacterium GW2011_GWB1_56_8]OGY98320.1 MAG: hypothetical protein A2681_01340 [Candidatus Liptonbacteria bacterium RIFCSPHIGHO2_01_FULL_56_18b]OGZ00719.1 MAG: hypothetical protein A3A43_00820 [Candidatus Liptonbacteria bacterium RIFCSPLOWO2_01_FULL_56_20]